MSLSVSIAHSLGAFRLDVAFQAPPGVTALFGPSGAGKTTVVNAVAGLLTPDAGRIEVDGTILLDRRAGIDLPPHRRRAGYVFQDARLFPHLSVRQNLLYGRWFGRGDGPGLAEIVDLLGLGALLSRRPAALSGGEAQRVALGRALLSRPRLLLMDEPMAALDRARRSEILPWFERLRDVTRIPILYVSHSAEEVARLATTVVHLDRGRVAAQNLPLDKAPGVTLRATLRDYRANVAHLDTPAGPISISAHAPPLALRLRIDAATVLVALSPPEGLLGTTVIPAVIEDVRNDLLHLRAGQALLLARRPPGPLPATGTAVHAVLTAPPRILPE
ncbi:molybdenum ABC transporter ATP-binding protein [Paracoccus rhizosphaerae]|uniref:Molybdenum ABC transporter ATP-binding protein n=1 Tax=Paracoccus rhizosphaerae TaxID=1133347 RepID=A0ABV6CIY3_9RHOB|nr:molybdenum ABC transporter ATP-binding protein [Paracoccus rhizosphaerae]